MKSIEFFDKSLGTWKSFRTYMYPLNNKIETLETEFIWENTQPFVYIVKWCSEKGEGSLTLKLVEDKIEESFIDIPIFLRKDDKSTILVNRNLQKTLKPKKDIIS